MDSGARRLSRAKPGEVEQDTCRGSVEELVVQLEHSEIGGPGDGFWGLVRD